MSIYELSLKRFSDVAGHFVIGAYQRGYRWRKDDIVKLLDDLVANGDRSYCLQPIVVKKLDGEGPTFELVDGQQRLTTLYLVLDCLCEYQRAIRQPYSIEYRTRMEARQHGAPLPWPLVLDPTSSIDAHFLVRARADIASWLAGQPDPADAAAEIYRQVRRFLHVIWYVAAADVDAVDLFRRLNVGRIRLTNAELVKARLLLRPHSARGEVDRQRQFEVAAQWDAIEHDLQDQAFWAFLTPERADAYPTRIELLLEWAAGVSPVSARGSGSPEYEVFDWFDKQLAAPSVNPARLRRDEVWEEVVQTHQLLREWFHDRDLFHRIGFLVWAEGDGEGSKGALIPKLLGLARAMPKSKFSERICEQIRDRLALTASGLAALHYEKATGVLRALTLFNVETMRCSPDFGVRFPFERHRASAWSLEHIHARHGKDLTTRAQWRTWLEVHAPSLRRVATGQRKECEQLGKDVREALENGDLNETQFQDLRQRMLSLFGAEGEGEAPDFISNLALMEQADNSALSNAEFDVKRRLVLELGAKKYVPICTRRVFAKFYTDTAPAAGVTAEDGVGSEQALQHWSQRDRQAYLDAMIATLNPYLKPEAA